MNQAPPASPSPPPVPAEGPNVFPAESSSGVPTVSPTTSGSLLGLLKNPFLYLGAGAGLLVVGSLILYLFWGKLGLPPIEELQAQVRERREISKESAGAEAAERELERSGITDWVKDLGDQMEAKAGNIDELWTEEVGRLHAEASEAPAPGATPAAARSAGSRIAEDRTPSSPGPGQARGTQTTDSVGGGLPRQAPQLPESPVSSRIDPAQVAWLPRGVVPHFPKKDEAKKTKKDKQ